MLRPGIDRKYALALLGISVLLLAVGIALKPNPPEPKAAPSEGEIARIQRLTQQRRLRDLSSYLADSANAVGNRLVSIEGGTHNGVLWDGKGHILTAGDAATGALQETVALPDGQSVAAERAPLPPGLPFVALTAPAAAETASAPRGSGPELGAWVLAVARNKSAEIVFAHGLYQGSVDARCGSFPYKAVQSSAPLSAALVGGGVFTLEGALLGLIAECEGRAIAISAASIGDVLRKPISLDDQLEREYGTRVVARNEETSQIVQVSAVWDSSIAERAGLRPGDVVLALNDSDVHSIADLAPLAGQSASDHTLQVRRGRRVLKIRLPAAERAAEKAAGRSPQGITLAPAADDARVVVSSVAPDSPAATAGILAGDVIRRVDDAGVRDRAAALEALEKLEDRPVLLEIERNGKRLEVLVSP